MSTTTQPQPLKSADLDELKQQQLDATATENGRGDIAHVAGNTAEADGYQVPAHEAHRMHVRLRRSSFDMKAKELTHDDKIVILSPQEFERMEKNDSFAEYSGEDGEVTILHDPRPKARQLADKKGDVVTGSPAEAPKVIATLNDAQMRYKELTKEDAPTDKTLGWFIDRITELEVEKGANKTMPDAQGTKKPEPRNKADWQARFKELYGEDAPADKTIEELKEAINHKEKGGE